LRVEKLTAEFGAPWLQLLDLALGFDLVLQLRQLAGFGIQGLDFDVEVFELRMANLDPHKFQPIQTTAMPRIEVSDSFRSFCNQLLRNTLIIFCSARSKTEAKRGRVAKSWLEGFCNSEHSPSASSGLAQRTGLMSRYSASRR
jgi:hypothetical protein